VTLWTRSLRVNNIITHEPVYLFVKITFNNGCQSFCNPCRAHDPLSLNHVDNNGMQPARLSLCVEKFALSTVITFTLHPTLLKYWKIKNMDVVGLENVCWDIVPCCLIDVYWRFTGACCLWNVGKLLPD
jgi:hypothetical protein